MAVKPIIAWWRTLVRHLLALILLVVGACLVAHWWCAREAKHWYEGEEVYQEKLARGVGHWIKAGLGRRNFRTGDARFDGEWLFGTYMMAGMGFGQSALDHPGLRDRHLELMDICIDRLLSAEVRAFEIEAWGEDPIETLDGGNGHAGYLGYFNLLLSLHRLLQPHSKYAKLNDRITAALARRLEQSPALLICTYPEETYPVDNCAVIGSIGLYDRATGADHSRLIGKWVSKAREKYVDDKTGLLYQVVDPDDGSPVDRPRGSGTCLGLYFLSFADMQLSADLYRAVKKELARTIMGFGAVREYPVSLGRGPGDIDSGPIILGLGLSPTGFSLGASRIHRDKAYFSRLFATTYLFGAPVDRKGRRNYVTGGPIGDAIMFAMLTAGRHQDGRAEPEE